MLFWKTCRNNERQSHTHGEIGEICGQRDLRGKYSAIGEKPEHAERIACPPESKTTFVASLGSKQCKTIAGTLTDPQDLLIIEGYPQINQETGAVAVFATCVTSKPLQAAKRERQKKESQYT